MFARPCLILVLALMCIQRVSAQAVLGKDFSITVYDDKTSLPQNTVRDIEIDKHGFMWLATELGLVRFDGEHFKIFNTSNSPAITSNRIQRVYKMGDELYMLDGELGGIIHINSTTQRLEREHGMINDFNIIIRPEVVDARAVLNHHPRLAEVKKILKQEGIAMSADSYYQFADSSIFTFPEKDSVAFYISRDSIVSLALPRRQMLSFHFMLDNKVYLWTGKGFAEVANGRVSRELVALTGPMLTDMITAASQPRLFFVYRNNNNGPFIQWNGALYSLHKDAGAIHSVKVIDSLPDVNVTDVRYLAASSSYALGSQTKGLFILKKKHFRPVLNPNQDNQINNNYAQLLLQNGKLLTSTGYLIGQDGGFEKAFDGNVGRYSFFKDSRGRIYYMHNNLLQRTKNIAVADYSFPGSFGDVRGITEDKQGNIWFGHYGKLYRIRENNSLSAVYDHPENGYWIESIYPINDSLLWIGTRGGIYSFSTRRLEIVDTISAMHSKYIRRIQSFNDSILLVATYGEGFYMYNNKRFFKMPVDQHGYLLTPHCFVEDDNSFIWIPTNKGLFQFAKADLLAYARDSTLDIYYQYYDETNGFTTNEFNGGCSPCSQRLVDGTISLPSINGLVWFNPAAVKPVLPVAELVIDNITIGKDTLAYTNNELNIPADQRILTIELATAYFGDQRNVKIEYALDGRPAHWEQLPERIIRLSGLPYGSHELIIRKQNGFGIGNYSEIKLQLQVERPWYLTGWFILLAALALAGLAIALVRLRTNYLHNQNRQLELVVKKRTLELEKKTAELQKSNELKEKLTAIFIHDLRSPMKFISSLSNNINRKLKNKAADPALLEVTASLSTATSEIYNFIDESVLWIKARQEHFTTTKQHFLLNTIIAELEAFFAALGHENTNTIQFKVANNLRMYSHPEIIKVITRNFIDNANKYTNNGIIHVEAYKNSSVNIISIADNGRGLHPSLIEFLQNPQYEDGDFNIGLGFRIIKEMLLVVKGHIEVWSEKGVGTTIKIVIPD